MPERRGFRDKLDSILESRSRHISLAGLILVALTGLLIRGLPAKDLGLGPSSFEAWRAVYFVSGGEAPLGSPALLAGAIAKMLLPVASPETVVSLLPLAVALVGFLAAFHFACRVSGRSGLAGLVAASMLAFTPTVVTATGVGVLVEDTLAVALVPIAGVLLYYAFSGWSGAKSVAAAIALGGLAGLSGLVWPRYYLLALVILAVPVAGALLGRRSEAAAASLAALAGSAISGLAGVPGAGNPMMVASLASALTSLAALAYERGCGACGFARSPAEAAWISFLALALAGVSALSGALTPPPELSFALGLPGFNAEEAVLRETVFLGVNVLAALREAGVWAGLAIVGLAALLVRILQERERLASEDVVASVVYFTAAGSILLGILVSAFVIPGMAFLALAAGAAIGVLYRLGLTPTIKDDLSAVVIAGILVFLAVQVAFDASVSLQAAQFRAPQLASGFGALYMLGGDNVERVASDAWERALQALDDGTVITWLGNAYIVDSLTEARVYGIGGYGSLDLAMRVLTANEDEAAYLLRDEAGLQPGQVYVVVHEIFYGVYDLQQNTVILYPVPSVQSVPQVNTYYVIHGRQDMGSFFQMLKIGDRVPDNLANPFDTEYATEAVNQGVRVFHFPGLLGQPPENLRNSREALVNRMLIDAVYKLAGDQGELGAGCDFIAETAVFVPGVYMQSPFGGMVQPLFLITDFQRFEPVKVVASCPSSVDQEDRIEFTLELVAIYRWTG